MAFVFPPNFHDVWPTPTWGMPLVLHVMTFFRACLNLCGQSFLFVGLFDLLSDDPTNVWKQCCVTLLGLFFFMATNTFLPNAHVTEDTNIAVTVDAPSPPPLSGNTGAHWATKSPNLSTASVNSIGQPTAITTAISAVRLPPRSSSLNEPPSSTASSMSVLPVLTADLSSSQQQQQQAEVQPGTATITAGPRVLFVTNPLSQTHPGSAEEVSIYFVVRTVVAMLAECVHGVGLFQLLDMCIFPETWLRNGLYVLLGLVLMGITGTLLDNACIAPMQANLMFPHEDLAHGVSEMLPMYRHGDGSGQGGAADGLAPGSDVDLEGGEGVSLLRRPLYRRGSTLGSRIHPVNTYGSTGNSTRTAAERTAALDAAAERFQVSQQADLDVSTAARDQQSNDDNADDDDDDLFDQDTVALLGGQSGVGRFKWHAARRRWSAFNKLTGNPAPAPN
jgi:hypothetical protein